MKGGGLLALLSLAAAGAVIALNLPPTLPLSRSTLGPRTGVETVQAAPPAPTATSWSTAAFRGLGKLAFVSHGMLYVLDGATGSLTQITRRGIAGYPSWSHDGRWLAFDLATHLSYGRGQGRLWLVRADGSDRHAVGGTAGKVWFGGRQPAWSPRADVVAVAPQTSGRAKGLWLVPTTGSPHLLAFASAQVDSFLWSPDGAMIAAGVLNPGKGDTLATVPASGGPATPRFHAPAFTGLILAAYSPHGRRIAFWEDPQHSGSIAADGLPLFVMPLGGGVPVRLPATLPYRSWLSWSPGGRTLAMVEGRGRQTWGGKGVAFCDPTGQRGCPTALRAPGSQGTNAPRFDDPGMVTLDPAWSPGGGTLALVQAVSRGGLGGWGGCPQPRCSAAQSRAYARRQFAAWLRTRVLWLVPAAGSGARPLRRAGTGIYDPRWSARGRHLLYIRGDAVWEVAPAGGPARRIAGPVDGANAPYGYYGHVGWSAGWAWHR